MSSKCFFTIIFLLTLNFSFAQGKKEDVPELEFVENSLNSEENENQQVGKYSEGLKVGEWKTFNKRGQLLCIESFVLGNREGLQTLFYPTGEMKIKCYFKNDTLQGSFILYHKNGNVYCKEYYSKGVLEGLSIVYYENGSVHTKKNCVNGGIDGISYTYDEKGKLIGENSYVKGKAEGLKVDYYSNGTIKEQQGYKKGIREGDHIKYDKLGKVLLSESFINGKIDGRSISEVYPGLVSFVGGDFRSAGANVILDINYKNGVPNGKLQVLSISNSILVEGYMLEGKKNGEWKYYYDNGSLKIRGCYFGGNKIEILEQRNEQGELIK